MAILNFLRQLCSVARQSEAAEGNIFTSILFIVLGCLISLLDWAVQFLNRYAFSYIALYGKPYFAAAKDTWNMIKQRGIDALINECLLGPVFSMGATFVGFACALLAHLYLVSLKHTSSQAILYVTQTHHATLLGIYRTGIQQRRHLHAR